MDTIVHITTREQWAQAQDVGWYETENLSKQGFIHCALPEQAITIANALFHAQQDLVLLAIDAERVEAEIRYENSEGGRQTVPAYLWATESGRSFHPV